MALEEVYRVDCQGVNLAGSKTYEFRAHPGPGEITNEQTLIEQAKTNLLNDGLAQPPYTGVLFNVRLMRQGEG
jgi:hypothetical protein